MKKYIVSIFIVALLSSCVSLSQINQERAVSGISKVIQAATITDEQMAEYVKEYITETDAKNKICGENNSYTKRLKKLTTGLTDANGIPLIVKYLFN